MGENTKKETRGERFKRIASARTQKALEALRLLGNCSNRSAYKYEKADVDKIFKAIESELKRIKTLFVSTHNNFKL